MPGYSAFAFAVLLGVCAASAEANSPARRQTWSRNVLGPSSQLALTNSIVSPDGFARSAVLAGGSFPGPLIQAQKGGEISVNVVNQLVDESMPIDSSIHWHGIFQHETNWADGTSYITQCPIPANESLVYQFNPGDQTGTYWYHSHYSTQYCDGLRGPLVIYDPNDPLGDMYDVDDETTVITLADWYHITSPVLGEIATQVVPNSTVINGLGRYSGGPSSPLAVINVEQGKRYRFRIIGLSCASWFNFTIDGHDMTIIEADGVETEPMVVDSLPVFPGQRYSVVVTANQTVGNYWIRASADLLNRTFEGGLNSAILRYEGADDEDPTTEEGPYDLDFNESLLVTLNGAAVPGTPEVGKADVNLNLIPGHIGALFNINNVSFEDPTVPILLQILSGATHASQLLPNGSVYELPSNKVIELSFPATDGLVNGAVGGPHPMHLHGHNFWVIRSAGNSSYNFDNPIMRDTVSMGTQGDNVTVRFVTNNPGPWFFHCHIDWHLHHGFAVVMAENPAEAAIEQSQVVPPDWRSLCPANLTGSG
ncbi:laccase [Pisolithus thermaeus]|nr:laccase [Pisolithus thermaeus]